jgi:hypothetical protein
VQIVRMQYRHLWRRTRLDDYHVIDSKAVDKALTFLVEHSPSQMHLVIATRKDPHRPPAPAAGAGRGRWVFAVKYQKRNLPEMGTFH